MRITGADCGATVEVADSDGSVYGSLMQVVAQLDGYARATGACRDAIQKQLLSSVGPDKPSSTTCTSASVTCSLFDLKSQFGEIADRLIADGDAALAALDPNVMTDAMDAYTALSGDVDAVVAQLAEVLTASPSGGLRANLSDLADRLGSSGLERDLDSLAARVDDIHDGAVAARAAEDEIIAQVAGVASDLCADDDIADDDLDAPLADLTGADCEGASLGDPGNSVSGRLQAQLDAWDAVIEATNVGDARRGLGEVIADLRARLTAAQNKLADARDAVGSGDLGAELAELEARVDGLADARNALGPRMTALQTQQAGLEAAVTDAFAKAAAAANGAAERAVDTRVSDLTSHAAVDAQALGEMFARSAAGLTAAAEQITTSGAKVIDDQLGQLAGVETEASEQVSRQISVDLAAIADEVTSSSRDVDAASTLLTNDLRRVLLDLGERRVKGSGLLGAMATSAATADTADYQLALASQRATSYANVRASDVEGILLRQAQVTAALQALADLPPFRVEVPAGAEHRTVYTVQLAGTK